MELKIEYLDIEKLKPYEKNARKHHKEDISAIVASIREFGFDDPIGIWSDSNIIVEGHGRLLAAKELGLKKVPCIRLDHLTEEQRRAYALAHNRTAELSEWDFVVRDSELLEITEIDMSQFFNLNTEDWFEKRDRDDTSRQEGNEEYNEFLDKFEQAKTTDDCYTPDLVYDAVAEWVVATYGVNRKKFVRPFFPGGDYERYKYPEGCVVVDNPPFSILAQILKFYDENNILFFLFAPALTMFSSSPNYACALCVGANVVYENGAIVNTSFLTNLEDNRLRSAPDLYQEISKAVAEYLKDKKRELPKYEYPQNVVTSSMVASFSKYGIDYKVSKEESAHIRQLDSQKESGKTIFGGGYLISEKAAAEKAAAEKAAAEKAAAEVWSLSDREREIIRGLK